MAETKNNDERFPEVKPTKPGNDTAYIAPIIGKLGYDTRRPWLFGLGTSPNNGVDFHVFLSFDGLNFDDNDIDKIWNGGTADKVKQEVDSATAEIPAAVSAANSAVSAAESAVAASKVNSDAIVAQSEAISEAKAALDSATAEIQQTAANAASDAAKIRADVAQVQSEVDTAKAANSASVEALKSDIGSAKKDLADVHDSLDKAQSAIEQNQKLINDNVAKITSDVSATKQDLATVHDSLTKAQAAAEQNQKAIDDSIAKINANVDATNQDLAGVRKDLTKAQSDITANQKAIDDNVAQISDDITQDRKDIADVRQGLTKAQSDIAANQKAFNDNVAQINSNIEQDRKDIASAQQANADTAKQLDTYSKQAQEQNKTIKAVQDKQDGFTATLADVQGNVTQVSDKVDGLSASLKDAQDNVASVKAQADQLSATLTDHAKSIATLTASAKELSSTLEDADGRLSKVEQTAQTNSSTLSDVQGDLSQVKQDATTLTVTLKDAQGNISTLQQKADSVSTQLASAQGDIATLQTGVDSVKATLTSHDKSIHTLQADSKSLKDSMADAQGDISTLSKTATDVTSELEDHTGRLSKVEQSAAKQATTLSDLQGNLSQVEQKADSNTATISSINKNAMQDRGAITDTKTSFDSLTQLGTYSIKVSGLSNMPEQHYGTLVVSGSAGSGWLSQQFVADTTGNVYTRVFSNNAWSAWKQGGSQDAINQVKQTADSNSATIRNVQGDVSTLKQTATDVEATLADHEGNIHTLQADDKSLKDSMADAQGDISTLQKTATSLDSELKDHAGRLSKVEQSAATQATTLSDLQGNLTQVKQQADGLVTTLKNAQGSITQIQQKADGTLAQLKSAQGDIASLQTDVTGIKATLTSHEGDIHTLQADSKTLRDDMTDAQGNISSLQKSSTKLDSEMSSQDGRLSKVEQTAKEHTSTISDLGDKLSNMKIGGRNLVAGTAGPYIMGFGIPNTTWKDNSAYLTLPTTLQSGVDEILPQEPDTFFYNLTKGTTYTQTVWFETDAKLVENDEARPSFTWYTDVGHDEQPSTLIKLGENKYKVFSTYTWPGKTANGLRAFDIFHLPKAFDLTGSGTYLKFTHLKLEEGNQSTDWTPAPEDLATVTQVKQTADGIETTLKSAQGDIDQIKQTAKGTSEQLADVKGNVTNIQKDVSGLKQTTADNAGNIHTLQSDSKSLHDSMQDAQGDISAMKKTSTDITSELKDHAGRISKVEQTAATLTNEFADQQGHLNRVEQTATGTEQTVANQQGQINNIKTDAAGMHQTITGQGNQIATINTSLNGLNTKYESVSGDLGKLKDQVTTNSTQITQNQQAIALKADQATVNNLSGQVSQAQAQLKVQADQISSKVSSTDFKTLNDNFNNMRIGGRNLLTGTRDWQGEWVNLSRWQVPVGEETYKGLAVRSFTAAWWALGQYYDAKPHTTYTFSFYAKASEAGNFLEIFTLDKEDWSSPVVSRPVFAYEPITTEWKRYSATFTTMSGGELLPSVSSSKDGGIYVAGYKLEEGTIPTDWSPAPEDAITAIQRNATAIDQTDQKISLKADQTEVDQVKNTATQNSSRLNVMANEISSKVTATDVNNIVGSKGYATTSTVQSLITQKAGTINENIVKLDQSVKAGAENNVQLVRKSDFEDGDKGSWSVQGVVATDPPAELGQSGMKVLQTNVRDAYENDIWYSVKPGEKFDVDFWFKPSASYNSNFGLVFVDKNKGNYNWIGVYANKSNQWKHYTGTITAPVNASFAKPWLQMDKDTSNTTDTALLAKPSIRRQNATTIAAIQQITASIDGLQSTVANKADKSQITQLSNVIQSKVSTDDFNNLRKAVDLQTLDSADINNMKTNGHYFVRNLANNPVGGWVYVDVTGNGADRIRQDIYQDNGNQHKYRRWFGDSWTAWSQGATESEITQLRDDINLRVKSGDLLSQINLTAHNTLIQSGKIYLDSSSTVFSGKAFIPSAAIVNLDVAKLNAGTINTDRIHIGDDSVYLSVKNNYLRLDGSNTKDKYQLRLTGNDIEFADNDSSNWEYRIQHGITKYQTDEDGLDFDVYSKRGGANHTVMAVSDAGVMISPSLFFQTDGIDSSNWMGFTRNTVDGNSSVSFHTWDDNNEGFHVDCGARFMNYVYINGYARAQGWLTNSTLSKKTNIRKLDLQTALDKIRQDDQYLYEYKRNVAKGIHDPQASFIIDDIHDVAQYSVPREFIDQSGEYREPNVELAYLVAAFQALDKQVQSQQAEIKKLKEQLNND